MTLQLSHIKKNQSWFFYKKRKQIIPWVLVRSILSRLINGISTIKETKLESVKDAITMPRYMTNISNLST